MPPWLPVPLTLVYVSGLAEMGGGAGMLPRRTRKAASVGVIALLLAVFPANVQMLLNWQARGVTPWAEALLWLRLPLQALFIWWAWKLRTVDAAAPAARPR